MKIALITPQAASARTGNRHTAQRYAAFLREGGHRVKVASAWDGRDADLLLALHARKSHHSVARFHDRLPFRPVVVVLTGTDLYRDIRVDPSARESLDMATLLVTLQDRGGLALPRHLRERTRVVYQSAAAPYSAAPVRRGLRVCVLGHLRGEKDPFRAALALRHLTDLADLEVVQVGDALEPAMAGEARALMAADRRYRWIGGVPHARALRWLASSHLLVVSSWMEGGANVICEAARAGVPVIASRIPGNVGMLGAAHPGYYPAGDAAALARLLRRAHGDERFRARLHAATGARRALFAPAAERRGILAVVREAARLARYSSGKSTA